MHRYLASLIFLPIWLSATEPSSPPKTEYSFENQWTHAALRLELLEKILNPQTFTLLNQQGIKPGMTCLDIGSGLGGVAQWMAKQVGPEGSVTATDIDIRFLKEKRSDNFRVIEEDFTKNGSILPAQHFDLIHARNVLMHWPDKQEQVNKMVALLKPGGILVVEDMGIFDGHSRLSGLDGPEGVWKKEARDYRLLEKNSTISFHSGFTNHMRFRQAGLEKVQGDISGKLVQGNGDIGKFMYYSTLQLESEQNTQKEEEHLYHGILRAYLSLDSYWWDHLRVITIGHKPRTKPTLPAPKAAEKRVSR